MINKRIRVKICGFTEVNDVVDAIDIGVDAIGLVFYKDSKRFVSLDKAIAIKKEIPPFVNLVALFVNAKKDDVKIIQDSINPDLLQFHGDEDEDFCSSFQQKFLKAFRVGADNLKSSDELEIACNKYNKASGWLFDSYTNSYGGSGIPFDYRILKSICQKFFKRRVIVSGGINLINIERIIKELNPFAVDLSSSVEISPGIKSSEKMSNFMKLVKNIEKCVDIGTQA